VQLPVTPLVYMLNHCDAKLKGFKVHVKQIIVNPQPKQIHVKYAIYMTRNVVDRFFQGIMSQDVIVDVILTASTLLPE